MCVSGGRMTGIRACIGDINELAGAVRIVKEAITEVGPFSRRSHNPAKANISSFVNDLR